MVNQHQSTIWEHMGVSKNNGTPKWMVYRGKLFLKWMIWGFSHIFGNTHILKTIIFGTPPKTNMSPENQWLEDVFPIETVPLQGTC